MICLIREAARVIETTGFSPLRVGHDQVAVQSQSLAAEHQLRVLVLELAVQRDHVHVNAGVLNLPRREIMRGGVDIRAGRVVHRHVSHVVLAGRHDVGRKLDLH